MRLGGQRFVRQAVGHGARAGGDRNLRSRSLIHLVVAAVAISGFAPLARSAQPVARATAWAVPELDQAIEASCANRVSYGGVVSATVRPGRPVTLSVDCIVGHVTRGPVDECVRDCSYDDVRTVAVRLSAATIRRFGALGCAMPAACTGGLLRGPDYPSRVAIQEQGRIDTLLLDRPAIEMDYPDGTVRAWLLERRDGGRLFAWAAVVVPVRAASGTAGDAALFVSRRSFLMPSLRAAMTAGVGCGNVRLVTDRQLAVFRRTARDGSALSRATLLRLFDRPASTRKDC